MKRAGPVQPTDRVSDVLARDASLVEVFVRCSRAFERLRNPLTRRVMARLVTVEQAARMGGVAVDTLLAELDRALGVAAGRSAAATPAAPAPEERASPFEIVAAGAPIVELDVREDLRTGKEPFSRIMSAVASLPANAVLRLRAPFEPVPLFAVMAKRGFTHAARRDDDGDWTVLFARGGAAPQRAGAERQTAAAEYAASSGEQVLDVRGLEPPEPMVRTLAALERLAPGATLVQINARVPQFLLPILAERGWAYEVDTTDPAAVRVRIHRAGGIAGA